MNAERETTGESPGNAKPSRRKRRAGMSLGFALFAGAFLLGTVLQQVADWSNAIPNLAIRVGCVLVGLSAFAVALGSGFFKESHRFLTSVRFAVPAAFSLTAVSILGTLILQGQPEAALKAAYGSALPLIRLFMLHDVFHSYGFAAMLGLSAASLTLAVLRRRKITLRYAGVLAAHLGLLLVLAGAAIGSLGLIKGRLNLHEGQSADEIAIGAQGDGLLHHSLGFTVRLDDFVLLHYDPQYRVSVVGVAGRETERLTSVDPADKANLTLEPFGVAVLDYWPDHATETVVTAVSKATAGELPKIAALGLQDAKKEDADVLWVFDEGTETGGQLTVQDASLRFFWSQDRATRFLDAQRSLSASTPHAIELGGKRLAVEVGGTYSLPDAKRQIRVIRAFNDFVVNSTNGEPQNRSSRPNNPALEVEITDAAGASMQRTWLFARFPDFHGRGKGSPSSGIRYLYFPNVGKSRVRAIAVGETGELWALERGELASKKPLSPGQRLGLGGKQLKVEALHESVRYSVNHTTRSQKANNPVAWVSIQGKPRPEFLTPKRPLHLDKERVLVLEPKGGDNVRDYLSTVSILEKGRPVLTKTIEVNDPLEYRGYAFYQTDYRPEDPTFSGFQVVRDPGLWMVYLGFFVNVLGVVWALFLPRFFPRTRRAGEPNGEKS